jgi:hypothetical protein
VDTDILVYAHDADAGEKHAVASKAVAGLWESRNGIISIQVPQEFYVALTRKATLPVTRNIARRLISKYLTWELAVNDGATLLHASEIEGELPPVVLGRINSRGRVFEKCRSHSHRGLSHGQSIEGMRIQNPFLDE